jgi:hypothetical protein
MQKPSYFPLIYAVAILPVVTSCTLPGSAVRAPVFAQAPAEPDPIVAFAIDGVPTPQM